ncbi:MAG: flagellar basal body rod protein FlgC [Clostridiales bacterium]|nr:flagellar basal body rod protein FlgC [Clostridiales bacterium]
MPFLNSINISASALTAERFRMDTIAENLANIQNTRTADGGPYRRRYVIFQERQSAADFSTIFKRNRITNYYPAPGGGVRVVGVGQDDAPFKLEYNPTHPDADEDGYLQLPNVEVVQEMTDMMAAYRTYEANITALNTFKDMAMKTLEIGR